MSASHVIQEAEQAGIRFVVIGDQVKVIGNRRQMPAELIERLRKHKAAIIQSVRANERAEGPNKWRAHLIVYQGGKA